MKKLFSYLFAASTACTFSFWKMEESGVFKIVDGQQECSVAVVYNGDQTDEMFRHVKKTLNSKGLKIYNVYLYDPISKYLFILPSMDQRIEFPNEEIKVQFIKQALDILMGQKHLDIEEAKNSLGIAIKNQDLLQLLQNNINAAQNPDFLQFMMTVFAPTAFLIDTGIDKNIKQWIENNNNFSKFDEDLNAFYSKMICNKSNSNTWDKEFISPSGIEVNSAEKGVNLTKTLKDGTKKTIDFQEALGKYLEKQIYPFSDFSQSFIRLHSLVKAKKTPTSLYEKDITYKGTQREDSLVKEFLDKKERFCHLEKQKDLLNYSEILTIRYLIDKEDTSGKCTIIGTGIDKRTLITFHWVTELSNKDLDQMFED